MRIVSIAGLALAMTLPAWRLAQAQWIVSDPATEASTATTATNTGLAATNTQQISTYTGDLVSPTNQTQTNTKNTATNTNNIESTLTTVPQTSSEFTQDPSASANDSVINPMPTVQNVETALSSNTYENGGSSLQMGGGDSTVGSIATTLYNQNLKTNPGTEPLLDAQDTVLRVSSNIQGMAVENLTQLQTRLSDINTLINDLNSATSITQVDAINARLAIAEVAVQAQAAQAANLAAIATAQSEINRENENQAMRNEHLQTASLFQTNLTGAQ